MPTLYVENVPEDLYAAIRKRAQQNRSSISAEVLMLLAQNFPTRDELARRRSLVARAAKLRSRRSGVRGSFAPTEEMLREDRAR